MGNELVYACPDCGSPLVDYSVLEGGEASCRACSWKGMKSDLLAVPFVNKFGTQEEVLQAIRSEWRGIFGKFGTELGRFLVRWGFMAVDTTNPAATKAALTRYLTAMASASLVAVMQEREKQEKERVQHGS
jgi:DNA-directed RNA polymerase subunit RPC12/RpoP